MLSKKVKSRIFFLAISFISIAIVIFIVLRSLEENIVYFFSPSEIYNKTDISFDKSSIYNGITLIIFIINLIIIYLIYKEYSPKTYFLAIILGGSFGNLFDRYHYTAVPDFIDLNYNGYHWFIFNIADIFITIGIICLIFVELLKYKKVK